MRGGMDACRPAFALNMFMYMHAIFLHAFMTEFSGDRAGGQDRNLEGRSGGTVHRIRFPTAGVIPWRELSIRICWQSEVIFETA